MDKPGPVSTSNIALQSQYAQKRRGSDNSEPHMTQNYECERVLITHIRTTDVVAGLRRVPTGFYVTVEIDGKTTKTSIKPILVGGDVVEWDEEILLPSERSSAITFRLCAAFELGSRLGDGESLRQFKITVGEVLDRNEQVWPTEFLVPKDNEVFPSCSSLAITTERRSCDGNEYTSTPDSPESDAMSQLGQLTGAGHRALLRYRWHQDQRDLDEAIARFERVRDISPPDHPDRSDVVYNLATARFIRCRANNNCLDLDVLITLYQEALQLRPRGHSDHCATAFDLGFALLARFRIRGNEADRTRAKYLFSSVLELSPIESYVYQTASLALEMTEPPSSIRTIEPGITDSGEADEEPIRMARGLLLQLLDQHPLRHVVLVCLAESLVRQFQRTGDFVGIHEAVSMLEDAVQVTLDSDPDKPALLDSLGNLLFCCFERLGDLVDINKSISVFKEAVRLTPNGRPNKPALLNNLGTSLYRRFDQLGDLADINKSVSMLHEAVRLTPDGHPIRLATWLSNLGNSLSRRSARLGDLADINKSISMQEEAVRLTPDGHPDKPTWLNNLGNSLHRRFDRLGDLADITKSISMQEEAVRLTPDDHPDKSARLYEVGSSLSSRFEHLGDLADVNKSISMLEEAMCLTPDGHPNKSSRLNGLATSLSRRFERLGDLTDINKSILIVEEAVRLTPDGCLNKPCWLNNLGSSLSSRFMRVGDLADITKSISMQEEAVRLTLDGDASKPAFLSNLGNSLLSRFERLGELADINKSISMKAEAVRLTPNGHPNKPAWLNNLGTSSLSRFEQLGDLADVNKSISVFEEVVRLTPDGHRDKPAWLNNLGNSLCRRFERLGDLADVNKSISMQEEAVRLTPDGHPYKPAWLNNIGNSFIAHFKHSNDPASLSASTLHFSLAACSATGHISFRFLASRRWALSARRLVQGNSHSQPLLDAYTTCINLLPELAWVGLPLAERHRLLLTAADVARDAAAAAVEAGCPEMAVGWLEQGRSVVWSQFLQLRTPVDELRVEHQALADQFQEISQALEQASSRENSTSRWWLASDSGPNTLSLEKETQRHHELAISREKLLADIRSLPGFDRFLLPKTIQQLATSAHAGPVVYLNTSKISQRCDALVVTSDLGKVLHVPLPDMSYPRVRTLQKLLRLLLEQNRLIVSRDDCITHNDRAVKVKPQRIEGHTPDGLFRVILAHLWESVVNPVLDALGFSTPPSGGEKKTRIFWCPTGPFAFLPIHAAGLHDSTSPGNKLSDFVISSYTPTLSALASSPQKDTSNASSNIRLVAVPQPPTDGLTHLPLVQREIDHIRTSSANSRFVTLRDSDGTVEDVLAKMESNSDWVHFACHGVQDPGNALNSGLCLADGRRLKLSDIIRLSRPRGGLAFLSACQTAQGDEQLSEESVHLAAGMLLAGYSGVIATMWSIMDPDAPKVTKDVYEHLFRDGKVPDSTEAAEALHHAVEHLRNSGASFFSWVPFIHVGL